MNGVLCALAGCIPAPLFLLVNTMILAHMGFSDLRVINDDIVAPGRGFGMHPHQNMEIVTYVLTGTLEHRDSTSTHATMRPDEVQIMSAGTGIMHSEMNPDPNEPVHLLQIWILPGKPGLSPRHAQMHIPQADKNGRLRPVLSPDGRQAPSKSIKMCICMQAYLTARKPLT